MSFPEQASRRLRMIAWVLLLSLALMFLGFNAATVDNYTQVVIAKVSAEVEYEAEVNVQTADGGYDENSLFTVWINFTASNPSPKPLRMWIIQIRAWVRDYEVEDGKRLDRAFRDDRVRVETESGVQTLYYYPVLIRTKSYISVLALIDPWSNATFSTLWQISSSIDRRATETVASIYEYVTTAKGMEPDEVEWYYFAEILMFVHGVRRDYTGLNDAYLLQLPLIVRSINVDIS
ncbi:MAG: hypothetical protein ACE5HJ_04935 [Thermoplasmata archaeon]